MITTPAAIIRACLRACAAIFCLVSVFWVAPPAAWSAMIPPSFGTAPQPLLPDLDYFIDVTGTMDVEEIATKANASAFRRLNLRTLQDVVGVTWLRFTIAPLPPGEAVPVAFLDLGQDVPADTVLYEPRRNPVTESLEWGEMKPRDHNLFLFPTAGPEARICYIRLDGLPGIWFAPMIRSPQNTAVDWIRFSGKAAILALGIVLILCILRGLTERGQWRIWTALYVVMALVQALLGTPAYGSTGITSGQAAAVLTPGLALMLLPHVGRHLMGTQERARLLDVQFLLLTLPGAVVALLPLLPGFGWIIRYLPLWPAGTLLFTVTALAGAVMGMPGARRYLLGCCIPPIFVAAGILGMDFQISPELLASTPLWGTALGALFIAGTGLPRPAKKDDAMLDLSPQLPGETVSSSGHHRTFSDGGLSLEAPLDDPNLRLLPPQEEAVPAREDSPPPPQPTANPPVPDKAAWEQRLRMPLDRLLRAGAGLDLTTLPPTVRTYAETVRSAADEMATILGTSAMPTKPRPAKGERSPFNLQHLLRQAHDAVTDAAEHAGIGIAWYMPPLMGHMYTGPSEELRETLELLLESAVRATRHGAVHLSVRRMPGSTDPGYVLFTVSDTGTGLPPRERSPLALAYAWELAGAHEGYLNVDCGPEGTKVTFSLHLTALDDEETTSEAEASATPPPLCIAVAAENTALRHALAATVREQGCHCTAAATLRELLPENAKTPALMVVVQPAHDDPVESEALLRFAAAARQQNMPFFKALAITVDDSQWTALAERGYTHALLEPVSMEAFATTVRDVLANAVAASANAHPPRTTDKPKETPLPDLFGPGEKAATRPEAASTKEDEAFDATVREVLREAGLGDTREATPSPARAATKDGADMPSSAPTKATPPLGTLTMDPLAMPARQRPSSEAYGPDGTARSPQQAQPTPPADHQGARPSPHAVSQANKAAAGASMPTMPPATSEQQLAAAPPVPPTPTPPPTETAPASGTTPQAAQPQQPSAGIGADQTIPMLVARLDAAMQDAQEGYRDQRCDTVGEAAERIALESEAFGFRVLARMARCVERAAKAGDMHAVKDLLPELSVAVERNRKALTLQRPLR